MKLCDEELFCSRCYVNGQWLESREGRRLRVFDPASGERIGSVPALGRSETAAAITAAHAAWAPGGRWPPGSGRGCCDAGTTCSSPTWTTWRGS